MPFPAVSFRYFRLSHCTLHTEFGAREYIVVNLQGRGREVFHSLRHLLRLSQKDQWEIITFKGDKYQLPSDENDITHGKYTIKFIREKYDNLKLSERLFLSMTKYLEERCYK